MNLQADGTSADTAATKGLNDCPARVLLATATAMAALAIAAPGAYTGDWDKDDSSYSSEHHNYDMGGKHEEPPGGMHIGGAP